MVEELKIIADILKGVTDGALYGIVFYMVIDMIKTIAIPVIWAFSIYKIVDVITNRIGVKISER